MLHEADAILQRACPTLPVPLHGALEPMTQPGQRILMASNGAFVQFKRDWLDAVLRIGKLAPGFPLPYGEAEERLSLTFGPMPVALVEEFLHMARAALPNEVGAVVVWSSRQSRLRLEQCVTAMALPARLNCYWPQLAEDEEVILDLHSHGRYPAYFSATDDRDDTGFNMCGVLGNVDRDTPSAAFRLCANGYKRGMRMPWDRVPPWQMACPP